MSAWPYYFVAEYEETFIGPRLPPTPLRATDLPYWSATRGQWVVELPLPVYAQMPAQVPAYYQQRAPVTVPRRRSRSPSRLPRRQSPELLGVAPPMRYREGIDRRIRDFHITRAEYFHLRPYYDRVNTSVLVFARDPVTYMDKLLLVQRSENDSNPGKWETPGGGVDGHPETILQGAARELREETGLSVHRFTRELGKIEWETIGRRRLQWIKFFFEVEVDEAADGVGPVLTNISNAVVLNPREHQQWAWVTEDDVFYRYRHAEDHQHHGNLNMVSSSVVNILLGAFRRRRHEGV